MYLETIEQYRRCKHISVGLLFAIFAGALNETAAFQLSSTAENISSCERALFMALAMT